MIGKLGWRSVNRSMDMAEVTTLEFVLRKAEDYQWSDALYLPNKENWTLSTPRAIACWCGELVQ